MHIYIWAILGFGGFLPAQASINRSIENTVITQVSIDPSLLYKAKAWEMTSYLKKSRDGEFIETMEWPVYYTFFQDGTYSYKVDNYEAEYTGNWILDPVTGIFKMNDHANPSYVREYIIADLSSTSLTLLKSQGEPQEAKMSFRAQ